MGHQISGKGISLEPSKVKSILEWPTPTSVDQVYSFIGTVSYCRRFIKDFAKLASPMTQLFRKGVEFKWEAAQQNAFDLLKMKISKPPILAMPNYNEEFNISSDASTKWDRRICLAS